MKHFSSNDLKNLQVYNELLSRYFRQLVGDGMFGRSPQTALTLAPTVLSPSYLCNNRASDIYFTLSSVTLLNQRFKLFSAVAIRQGFNYIMYRLYSYNMT